MKSTAIPLCIANTVLVIAFLLAATEAPAAGNPQRPVEGIMDNSFLVEEAYNQEPGVVQHIFNAFYAVDKVNGPDDFAWALTFTQEWPVLSQKHQFSYTVPYSFARTGGVTENGVGDLLLHYRYQALYREATLTAFAPRLSLVLPSGDQTRGLGDDTMGVQWNLPFSTAVGDRWFVHLNGGGTYLPDAGAAPRNDLRHYNLGGSLIYALRSDCHLLLEWVGDWTEVDTGAGRTRPFNSFLSPGVRKAFDLRNDAQLVLGVAAPVGLNSNTPDFGVFLYVSFEHFFKR